MEDIEMRNFIYKKIKFNYNNNNTEENKEQASDKSD
jgi:hypothetical protein